MGKSKELIAQNIKRYRMSAGMSQKDLATALNVSAPAVSNWENGANSIEIDTLVRVCGILKVSVNTMLGFEEDKLVLSHKEEELVKAFRRCTRERQDIILELVGLKRDALTSGELNNAEVS